MDIFDSIELSYRKGCKDCRRTDGLATTAPVSNQITVQHHIEIKQLVYNSASNEACPFCHSKEWEFWDVSLNNEPFDFDVAMIDDEFFVEAHFSKSTKEILSLNFRPPSFSCLYFKCMNIIKSKAESFFNEGNITSKRAMMDLMISPDDSPQYFARFTYTFKNYMDPLGFATDKIFHFKLSQTEVNGFINWIDSNENRIKFRQQVEGRNSDFTVILPPNIEQMRQLRIY